MSMGWEHITDTFTREISQTRIDWYEDYSLGGWTIRVCDEMTSQTYNIRVDSYTTTGRSEHDYIKHWLKNVKEQLYKDRGKFYSETYTSPMTYGKVSTTAIYAGSIGATKIPHSYISPSTSYTFKDEYEWAPTPYPELEKVSIKEDEKEKKLKRKKYDKINRYGIF